MLSANSQVNLIADYFFLCFFIKQILTRNIRYRFEILLEITENIVKIGKTNPGMSIVYEVNSLGITAKSRKNTSEKDAKRIKRNRRKLTGNLYRISA